EVTLLTSHPELMSTLSRSGQEPIDRWRHLTFRSFDDLEKGMEESIRQGELDAVIHCAAVSDYREGGIYAPAPGSPVPQADGRWTAAGYPALVDKSAAKVKSDEPELWLRLVRTPKLVDRVRTAWSFRGILVKFKLEVGASQERLLWIAEHSRRQSDADLMVANMLETAQEWAFLGPQE